MKASGLIVFALAGPVLGCGSSSPSGPAGTQGAEGSSGDSASTGDATLGTGNEAPNPDPDLDPDLDMGDAQPVACVGDPQVVTFATADGVTLEADFVPSGQATGRAAVLLHMIPPSNDRTNYPASFVNDLAGAGYTVLNVDRRGAGGSQGEPLDAYEGPSGKEDALAAVSWLGQSDCAIDPSQVVLIGASNGTTTALDYTVAAATPPRALVFLSPGAYTENQSAVSEQADRLSGIRLFIGYPDSERAWPESVQAVGGESWVLQQYDGGSHGSGLFRSSPTVSADILGFLAGL